MHSHRCLFAVAILFAVSLKSFGQSTPIVAELNAADVPKQSGLRAAPEDVLATNAKYPAVVYRNLVFVAYSHLDNRSGMTIVGFDRAEKPRVKIQKEGARYLRKIKVDSRRKVVRFIGQNKREIVVPWKRLVPTATKNIGLYRERKDASVPKSGAKTTGLDIATGFSQPKDFATAMRDLEKMQSEWAAMEKEMKAASADAADSVRKERAAIAKELKRPTINYETATRLTAMAALLDVTIMGQMLGDAFSGGGMNEQDMQREMKTNTQLIQQIRAKVAGESFTSSESTRKKLLGRIDKMLAERAKAASNAKP